MRRAKSKPPITARQAFEVLNVFDSGYVKIYHYGQKSSPRRIGTDYDLEPANARRIRIVFESHDGSKMLSGSMADMMFERMGLPHKARKLTKSEILSMTNTKA